MKTLKKLSRGDLKSARVGSLLELSPSGCYVCCWEGTNNCSTPVNHDHTPGTGSLTCVSGAELKKC
ncbi:hypothetical protein [Elizabethkingia anophelis]|uniref:hypothetical protein n=1 Tax=Elizabethkingia anophelis TaxID=1117645 RepID=UPI001115BFA3|nr:hypothetical protein [Elizabethkingia anophelis]MCT3719010.1 hypothetical protein [Elizabethkingia anophelis]MCT3722520.1 hypothetical protein [Elizabethkingia anophelis]MCT3754370.1 hypothetical protein [Elizabethkingia anophelis]MCT3775165.1 hypothetical protein [Elizabethkingia anophelis]MCT3782772.1 hypothetical protein [Elizabethkingia anophelis]